MPRIQLSRGLFTEVSEEDFLEVSKFKWYACCKNYFGNRKYYARRDVYIGGKRTVIYLHHWVYEQLTGAARQKGYVVDHGNGDSLNNRRDNLSEKTKYDNEKPFRDMNEARKAAAKELEDAPF